MKVGGKPLLRFLAPVRLLLPPVTLALLHRGSINMRLPHFRDLTSEVQLPAIGAENNDRDLAVWAWVCIGRGFCSGEQWFAIRHVPYLQGMNRLDSTPKGRTTITTAGQMLTVRTENEMIGIHRPERDPFFAV